MFLTALNDPVEVFTAASHFDILGLVTQISVLLFSARMLGELAKRMGQPSVVGEILAGIILGPSCLGAVFPFFSGLVIPTTLVQGYLIETVSLIGVIFLLLVTGLETDLKLILRQAKTALSAAMGGIVLPFITGFFLGQMIPEYLLVSPDNRVIFSLFIATAMSISAIPVLAKILIDLKLTRRDIGQTIIAAGMTDDTMGWILLSIVAGLAAGETVSPGSVAGSIGTVLAFFLFSLTAGRWFVKKAMDFVQDQIKSRDRLLTLVVVLTFAWAAISQALHIEAMIGAFVMGILLGHMPRLPHFVREQIETIALGIFAPIFFAVAGLKVNIQVLMKPDLMAVTLIVIAIACFGKIIGAYIGARLARKDHWTSLSFGVALNARGAMEIIVATIGLSLGILTQEMFSIIVVMAMVTSLMTPVALRWTLRHVHPSEEELARLQKEEMARESAVVRIHRILVPLRSRPSDDSANQIHMIKSRVLKRIGKGSDLSLTLLSVAQKGKKAETLKYLENTSVLFREEGKEKKEVLTKVVENIVPVNAVLDEAQKDYELIVLGASELQHDSRYLFSRFIDTVVELAPCMTMVVHAKKAGPGWDPKRILVPTTGSAAARHATEFAFLMSSSGESVVDILNVFEKTQNILHYDIHGDVFKRQLKIARRMVEELRSLGELHGVQTNANVEIGSAAPEEIILQTAKANQNDLIILGTDLRPASDRLYLGPRVEYILKNSICPVIILNSI